MEKQKLIDYYIFRAENALVYADKKVTKLDEKQLSLSGMSSDKIRMFLNKIVEPNYTRYLEIGVWQGSSFISALYNNSPECAIAIDNFSEFFDEQYSEIPEIEQIFRKNLADNGITNYNFIKSDCFNLSEKDKKSIKNIDVYMYDGGHTKEDHIKALTYYYDNLANIFILIIDDWNFPLVKAGTKEGIEQTNLKIHKEWELPSRMNGDTVNWWNGYYVAVCEKVK